MKIHERHDLVYKRYDLAHKRQKTGFLIMKTEKPKKNVIYKKKCVTYEFIYVKYLYFI